MKHYAIIGKPVSHSLSGQWFADCFRKLAIDADFRMIEPSVDDMNDFRNWVLSNQFDGLLVTIPFKMDVMKFLDETDELARTIGAVNVIHISDKKLIGYNTDYLAFEAEMKRLRSDGFKKAILMGIGGASAAVSAALERMNVSVIKVSRQKKANNILYTDLSEKIVRDADLIINATPLGMGNLVNEYPPINYEWIQKNALAYDLIYNPAETLFLKKCAEVGCQTANGQGMVEFVYERALEIWGVDA
ncbi:MAG TPA: shikimate dehydrogenase [Bacteroidales bacterium]|nr:shikimate dehydrogenase [Bacteroidales bacterium]